MERLAIIDFDTNCFREALTAQDDTFEIDPDFEPNIDYEAMYERIQDRLSEILYESKCTEYRIYLTGSNNYRYKFLPSYKWSRIDAPRPIALNEAKQYAIDFLGGIINDGEEADDSCTRDFTTKEEGIHKVLCHIDKDLDQVEGEHFNTDTMETYHVTKEEADAFLWYQVLAGDTADCYKGCPMVGGEISKSSVKGQDMSKKERVEGSKAMRIAKGTLCVRPKIHTFTRGKNKGKTEVKWEEYHDSTLTTPQRVFLWYVKGYVTKGGRGHVKGFDTTSGYEEDIKIQLDNLGNINSEQREFIENEINIQYNIAYMLRCGESIPNKLHKLNFN